LSLLPVIITIAVLALLFQGSRILRYKVRESARLQGQELHRAAMLNEAVSEGEKDIMALATSFLIVQVVRYATTGLLADEEGIEEEVRLHEVLTWKQPALSWCIGGVFVVISVVCSAVRGMVCKGDDAEEESLAELITDIVVNASAMASAWCMFAGARWAWTLQPLFSINVLSIDGRILLALTLSFTCFCVVYVLDQIDDALRAQAGPSRSSGRMIASIVNAVSVLVGFAWEHSFDGAVTAVASLNTESPKLTKFVLGVCVFVVLLRPWRKYILKRSMQLDQLKAQRDMAMQSKAAMGQVYTFGDYAPASPSGGSPRTPIVRET